MSRYRRLIVTAAALFASVLAGWGGASRLSAQQNSALRQLDRNRNGALDPGEVTPQQRPIVNRLAQVAGLNPNRAMPLNQLEAALSQLSARGRNNRGNRNRDNRNRDDQNRNDNQGVQGFGDGLLPPVVLGFGNGTGTGFVPGFGTGAGTVTQSDFQLAQASLDRFDRDDNGLLDERELRRMRLDEDEMMGYDEDDNERLDRDELAAALSMRRALGQSVNFDDDDDDDDRRRRDRDEEQRDRNEERRERDRAERERDRRREYEQMLGRVVSGILDVHDIDGDGVLSELECKLAGHDISLSDDNGDEEVTREELQQWIEENYPEPIPTERTPLELPEWFSDKDGNGDNQIALSEFLVEQTYEELDEFDAWDTDGDGFITGDEVILALRIQGDYQSNTAIIIPVDSRAYSTLTITDDYELAHIAVHLSITHTRDEDLDIYLISPDGVQVELAAGVGDDDDHFDDTIVDDEADDDFDDGDPPFTGRFRSTSRDLRNLYDDDDRANVYGTWTLLIVNDGDRAGMLHRWALSTQRYDD